MKLYRARAVVLNSREMRDAHRVLTLFSLEKGKIRAVAHGVDKPTSRKRGAVQPFSYSDFLLRRGRELDSISQCECLEVFPGLWSDLERMGYAAHVSELVDGLTADGEANRAVFELLLGTFRFLEKTPEPELAARGFELRLVSLLGYRPHLESCVNCGVKMAAPVSGFSAASGGLVCGDCSSGEAEVPCCGETVAVMKRLMEWDSAMLGRLRVSPRARGEMKKIMREYCQWLVEKRLRSLQFLDSICDYRVSK